MLWSYYTEIATRAANTLLCQYHRKASNTKTHCWRALTKNTQGCCGNLARRQAGPTITSPPIGAEQAQQNIQDCSSITLQFCLCWTRTIISRSSQGLNKRMPQAHLNQNYGLQQPATMSHEVGIKAWVDHTHLLSSDPTYICIVQVHLSLTGTIRPSEEPDPQLIL